MNDDLADPLDLLRRIEDLERHAELTGWPAGAAPETSPPV